MIPAFELESPTIEIPSSATTLRELLEKGEARQVHSFKGARAHAATDYQRWKSLGKTRNPDSQSENVGRELWYEVAYEYLWEPYVLVRKGEESQVPRYDERFIGYGNDKVSFVYELAASGYSFRVILDGFIIHKDHEKPKWRSDYGSQMNGNSQRGWKKWVEFVHDIKRRYKGFEVSVPEWLKRDCINRAECPEFWTWI